jgi:hypothetical protein
MTPLRSRVVVESLDMADWTSVDIAQFVTGRRAA